MIPIKSLFNIPIKYCLIARKYLRFTKKSCLVSKSQDFWPKINKSTKKTTIVCESSKEDSSKIGHDCRK